MLSAGFGCPRDHEEHPRVCLQVPVQPQQPGRITSDTFYHLHVLMAAWYIDTVSRIVIGWTGNVA